MSLPFFQKDIKTCFLAKQKQNRNSDAGERKNFQKKNRQKSKIEK